MLVICYLNLNSDVRPTTIPSLEDTHCTTLATSVSGSTSYIHSVDKFLQINWQLRLMAGSFLEQVSLSFQAPR